MAPELLRGELPNDRTDIYAYGKVIAELLPRNRVASRCFAAEAENRPESLEPIIRCLRGVVRRRALWALAALTPVASLATYERLTGPKLAQGVRQHLIVNGFRPSEASHAGVLRQLLITALRQSPLLTIVSDDHLKSALAGQHQPSDLPADRRNLIQALGRESLVLVLEGALSESVHRLHLALQVFGAGSSKPILQIKEAADDAVQVVRLADRAALRLREELGESATSLQSGHTPLERVTSSAPEAVEAYYRDCSHRSAVSLLLRSRRDDRRPVISRQGRERWGHGF